MPPPTGTFSEHPILQSLPALIRKQRRLEAQLRPLAHLENEEKAVRAQIDELLVAAGVVAVTCAGYDVVHNTRAGKSSLDGEKVKALLVASGLDAEFVDQVLDQATDTGKPAQWATVRPMKGARVQAQPDVTRAPATPVKLRKTA